MFTVNDSEKVDCGHEDALIGFIYILVDVNVFAAEGDRLYLDSCNNR